VRAELQRLIEKNAGKNLPVVFDFDNTIVCGDIGEATLAVLARSRKLKASKIPKTLSPAFRSQDGVKVTLQGSVDVTEYYDLFLAPTAHGADDPTPLANGYVWVVEVMEGLSPLEVIDATQQAFQAGETARPHWLEVTPGKTGFPAPFFYDQIVELIARLIDYEFDVWIVSASNVWSVRWMVARALNPRLREIGASRGLAADQVIGISTLLADAQGRLHKDKVLVRKNRRYAALEPEVLRRFRLTSRLQFPVPIYSGKVACVWDAIGAHPWLCVGDSPGDHAMLEFSEHRLWLARLEKSAYQQATIDRMRARNGRWMIQPLLCSEPSGFMQTLDGSKQMLDKAPEAVRRSLKILSGV
jgi:phosphoserine phosphatase